MPSTDPLDFTGKTVIVTGGTRGVGRGITHRFLERGANVVVCGRSEPEEPIAHAGAEAAFIAADVREVEPIQSVVAFAKERFGSVDVLVNNAGGAPAVDAATVSPRFHESIIRLNMIGPIHFAQAANAVMQEQETGGSIISIVSVSAVRPSPGTAAYGAAKAGLISFSASAAVEWAPKVRINTIGAGMIRTEQAHLHYGDDDAIARVEATVPLGRLGLPEDVGDACLFLGSPLSSYMTGSNIMLHGGGEEPAFLAAVRGD